MVKLRCGRLVPESSTPLRPESGPLALIRLRLGKEKIQRVTLFGVVAASLACCCKQGITCIKPTSPLSTEFFRPGDAPPAKKTAQTHHHCLGQL